MLFDFATLAARDRYKLMVSTITPRPIAWVVTMSAKGQLNAAPFSFFNAFSGDPPVIGIGVGSHAQGRPKDTLVNIEDTGQFVVHLVSHGNAKAMNETATDFDYGVDEMEKAGIETVSSTRVKPPRIAAAPVAMECDKLQIIRLGPHNSLVLGRILAMHVEDAYVLDRDKHYIDTPKLDLIGRMHGMGWYATTRDLFEMPRIPLSDWKDKT